MGDLFRLTQHFHLGANTGACVFHYEGVGGSNSAYDLALAFANAVLPAWSIVAPFAQAFDDTVVVNLDDPSDYGAWPFAITGSVIGDVYPPHVSLSYILTRQTRAIRNGHKRIGFVAEIMSTDGVNIIGAKQQDVDDLATQMGAVIYGVPAQNEYAPRIVRYDKAPPYTYTLFGSVGSCIFKGIGSCNSRKVRFP